MYVRKTKREIISSGSRMLVNNNIIVVDGNKPYVLMRPLLVDHLGIAYTTQYLRMKKDSSVKLIYVKARRAMYLALPIHRLYGFLADIDQSLFYAHQREKIHAIMLAIEPTINKWYEVEMKFKVIPKARLLDVVNNLLLAIFPFSFKTVKL